jgi:hypothetical protein
MSVIDESPYPIGKPAAQELIRVMAGLYRTRREAIPFTALFGIDELEVTPDLSTINLWHELLEKLAVQGKVRPMVKAARDRAPGNPRAPFLDALLADKPAPISAEPAPDAVKGPAFDDSVTEPEALLFFDDLTMPVGKVTNLIKTLNALVTLAPAICLLRVSNAFGSFFGTGFRISDSQILTNHHVLFPKGAVATGVFADFGFDVDENDKVTDVTSLPGAVATIKGEKADDWAVIEVVGMPATATCPVISLDQGATPTVGQATYILQHPGGQRKRLGFVRNTITDVDDGLVRYLTDTEPGSSGAPVFDTAGRLLALHHAGGRPVEVVGKPPVAKNEGIRISRVLERLKAAGVPGF